MTGYSGTVTPYVPDLDGNFIPFNAFSIVMYTVHDGKRIGQQDEYHNTIFRGRSTSEWAGSCIMHALLTALLRRSNSYRPNAVEKYCLLGI